MLYKCNIVESSKSIKKTIENAGYTEASPDVLPHVSINDMSKKTPSLMPGIISNDMLMKYITSKDGLYDLMKDTGNMMEQYTLTPSSDPYYYKHLFDGRIWIMKPANSWNSYGVKVVATFDEFRYEFYSIRHNFDYVLCEYIRNPTLISGRKFHVRYIVNVSIQDEKLIYDIPEYPMHIVLAKEKYVEGNYANADIHITSIIDCAWNCQIFQETFMSGDIYFAQRFKRDLEYDMGMIVIKALRRYAALPGIESMIDTKNISHKSFTTLVADFVLDRCGIPKLLEFNKRPKIWFSNKNFNTSIVRSMLRMADILYPTSDFEHSLSPYDKDQYVVEFNAKIRRKYGGISADELNLFNILLARKRTKRMFYTHILPWDLQTCTMFILPNSEIMGVTVYYETPFVMFTTSYEGNEILERMMVDFPRIEAIGDEKELTELGFSYARTVYEKIYEFC